MSKDENSNAPGRINGRLDIAELKMSKYQDIKNLK